MGYGGLTALPASFVIATETRKKGKKKEKWREKMR